MPVEFDERTKWRFHALNELLVKGIERMMQDPEYVKDFEAWCQTPMGKSFEGEPEYAD